MPLYSIVEELLGENEMIELSSVIKYYFRAKDQS